MPDLIRHPCTLGDGPRIESGVTERGVMPDLIRHPCVKGDGPRVKPGVTKARVRPRVTAEGCDTVSALQRPAKPMLREITSFMISLVPP
jgi:hypothetical protein